MRTRGLLLILCALTGCSERLPDSIGRPLPGEASVVSRYLEYRKLPRITAQRIELKGKPWLNCTAPTRIHGPHYQPAIHVYANRVAMASRRNTEPLTPYPVGSVLVKEKFDAKDVQTPGLITVMEKTANNGRVEDWQFMMIQLPERTIVREGFRISCIECHSRFSSTDFVSRETTALLGAYVRK